MRVDEDRKDAAMIYGIGGRNYEGKATNGGCKDEMNSGRAGKSGMSAQLTG